MRDVGLNCDCVVKTYYSCDNFKKRLITHKTTRLAAKLKSYYKSKKR